jgi:hypothetical protein
MLAGLIGAGLSLLAVALGHFVYWLWCRRRFQAHLRQAHKSPPPWLADINDDALIPIHGHEFEIVGLSPGGLILAYRHPTSATVKRKAAEEQAKERGEKALSKLALKRKKRPTP